MSDVTGWEGLAVGQRQQKIGLFVQSGDLALASEFVAMVKAPTGYGVYASAGPNYNYAVFGRDSIRVASDLMAYYPGLCREIIVVLASLQGMAVDEDREEEPGKIHHEYRRSRYRGGEVPEFAKGVLDELGPRWGGYPDEMRYYGGIDATPKFIKLVCDYVRAYGDEFLDADVVSYDGRRRKLRDHLRLAVDWLTGKLKESEWGLLEFKRLNDCGLPYQAWRDSDWAYIHEDGSQANADGGIASIDVQGDTYDALCAVAGLWPDSVESTGWLDMAGAIRRTTIEKMWMPEVGYFAQGLDRDGEGQARMIRTITSSPATLLASGIFDSDDEHDFSLYAGRVAGRVLGEDFVTDAGLRLRSLNYAGLLDFADYHGALVTWPVETCLIARGLKRHGFSSEAAMLEGHVVRAVVEAGEFYEFFLVGPKGNVKYHYRQLQRGEPELHEFGRANKPEPGQAWTISAVVNVVKNRL